MLVVAIVLTILVAALLLIAGYCFAKRVKNSSDNAPAFDGNIQMINNLNWV